VVVERGAASRLVLVLVLVLVPGCFQDSMLGGTTQTTTGEHGSSSGVGITSSSAPTGESTGHEAVCGDGVVEGDEQCDDANEVADDGCAPGCALPQCGDGLLSAGEACDDANLSDDDACTHLCAVPSCGDGIVSPGEQCDDGNVDPLDACDDCVVARCGDGVLQGKVEACDDGNLDPHDGCSAICRVNSCGNGVQDRDEAGLDCGGSCGACCMDDAGCEGGSFCFGTACRLPSTCAELQARAPELGSGPHVVDPDGAGALAPLEVHCEVVPEECAYTLLRIDDASLGKTQPAYVATCAALGWEIVVTRTPAHAERLYQWNNNAAANLLNVFPNFPKAMGLKNWSAVCHNQPCDYWMTADVNGDVGCMVSFEPSGDSNPGDRIERRLDGCGFEGNWNDFGQNVEIQGWVICSPNDC
jgi:cysteine-rich repeat protein